MKKVLALVLALSMVLACACAAAAEDKVYHVGILQLVQHNALDAATQGFMDTLTEKLGDKVVFDPQNAQGDIPACSVIATTFANNAYDLIMANATPAVQACVAATDSIPIVGTSVTDYGAALSNPEMDPAAGTGINVTGASDGVDAQLYVDMVLELVPEAKTIAVLYCSAEANSQIQVEQFVAALPEGVTANVVTFADSNDLQMAVTSAVEGADAMYIPTDNTAASNMTIISNVTQPAGLPVICGEENMMSVGGMATVSISYYDIGVLAAEQAYEILVNGADPAAIPIAYSSNPVKEYNAAYADAIGFAIPEGYTAYPAE